MTGLPTMYVGTHRLRHARQLSRCMISANQLIGRRTDFQPNQWIMDSGAFTRISRGLEHLPAGEYADLVHRCAEWGTLEAAVTQDWMCEPFVLDKAGGTVKEHQDRTTERWLLLRDLIGPQPVLMPVIQGWTPEQYAEHASDLSSYLPHGAWVGVGSVCKRQGRADSIAAVLEAVHDVRPDIALHGFGVKTTSLRSRRVCEHLATVDSMAWSLEARYARLRGEPGPGANDVESALSWLRRIEATRPDEAVQTAMRFR